MKEYDLIIVGGSFAGLSAAQSASKAGLRTLVLEKKKDPGALIRTTGIIVNEGIDFLNPPQNLVREIRGVRLYSPNFKEVDLPSLHYRFFATDTPNLMRWMTEKTIEAGAEVWLGKTYKNFKIENNSILLEDLDIKTRFLLGCDGSRSQVASDFNLSLNKHFLYGMEAEWVRVEGVNPDRLHVFLDSKIAPGYIAWVVPGKDIFQIGLAARFPCKLDLEVFISKLQSIFDFSIATEKGRRAGFIPCGGVLPQPKTGPVMLLGDAAGMVSPLTAGGIHPALEIGQECGKWIADYLNKNGPHPGVLWKKHVPHYRVKSWLRRFFSRFSPPNSFYNWILKSRSFKALAQTVFYHHRGLFSKEAWKDLVKIYFDFKKN